MASLKSRSRRAKQQTTLSEKPVMEIFRKDQRDIVKDFKLSSKRQMDKYKDTLRALIKRKGNPDYDLINTYNANLFH